MSPSNSKIIETYFTHFNQLHSDLSKHDNELHVKILSVTLMSALARGRYPKKGDGERFIKLIEEYSSWPDAQRVSIPQLALQIALKPKTQVDVQNLASNAKPYIDMLKSRPLAPRYVSDEPQISTLSNWPKSNLEKKILDSCKFSSLLYAYRCRLIHEYREPGYPTEFADKTEPYYISTKDTDTHVLTQELVYPKVWFVSLSGEILDTLKDYYLKNDIDPTKRYDFGSHWRENKLRN